jgi:hypothetical protein
MHAHLTHSLAPRVVAVEPTHDDMHPGRGVIAMPAHDEIARRAYEIYVKSDCKEGQCQQNWHQAELQLRTDDHRVRTEPRD